MKRRPHIVEADWTWVDRGFRRGIQIAIDDDGLIAEVGPLGRTPDSRLNDRGLLPGFVNAHSHAFQRGLRGRGETFPDAAGSFWTWREAMYELVEGLNPAGVYETSRLAFDEMLGAGITCVGEFHYLHHDDTGARDFAFDEIVLEAAHDAGIRIVLLQAYYRTGGIGRPLAGGQRRFAVADPAEYWEQFERLATRLRGPEQSLGVVAHSIRAASPGEVAELHAEARRRGLVFHMHLEEQRQEIEACREHYGRAPLELVMSTVDPAREFTAVHLTQTAAGDLSAWAERGGHTCICPLTEANLADGIADLPALAEAGAGLCLGTDSNARISMLEEMRWLEYVQRLERERRGVLADTDGEFAARVLEAATVGGARSLGLRTGQIAPGYCADLTVLDLTDRTLAGWQADTLAASLVCGGGDRVIAGTCVGGRWRLD